MILVSTISKIIPLHICPEVALLDHMVLLTEGNGNPLQCSCLENPRDGGARWAAVYGVAQSWTRLKRLSSSSMVLVFFTFLGTAILFFHSNCTTLYSQQECARVPVSSYPKIKIKILRTYLHLHVHIGIIYSIQDMETTYISIDR